MEMNRTKGQTTNRGTGEERLSKDGHRVALHRPKQYEELTFTDDFLFCKIPLSKSDSNQPCPDSICSVSEYPSSN